MSFRGSAATVGISCKSVLIYYQTGDFHGPAGLAMTWGGASAYGSSTALPFLPVREAEQVVITFVAAALITRMQAISQTAFPVKARCQQNPRPGIDSIFLRY